jgi:transcriptional regulator with PAS, ATPase and Fis domain
VVVVDDEYNVHYLNNFMERHASLQLSQVAGQSLFKVFADLPEAWLKRKLMSVLDLKTPALYSSSTTTTPLLSCARIGLIRPICDISILPKSDQEWF